MPTVTGPSPRLRWNGVDPSRTGPDLAGVAGRPSVAAASGRVPAAVRIPAYVRRPDGRVLRVRRAWPDPPEVVLELVDVDGQVAPGRWRPGHPPVVGAAGEDGGLPGLRPLVAAGAVVVGHRFGRRAVVRRPDGYTKVVRPARVEAVLARHRTVAIALAPRGAFAVPEVTGTDVDLGAVTFAPAAGSPMLDSRDPVGAAARTGSALGHLAASAPGDLPGHSAADEAAVLDRWAGAALRFATVPPRLVDRFVLGVEEAADRLRRLDGRPVVVAHRDLHDGQVLVDGHRRPVLLDLDTAAYADPALDVGNLLAHVDLARHERRLVPEMADAVASAFVDGRGLDASDAEAVEVYRRTAVLRLVAVHSFRPPTRAAGFALLDRMAVLG